MSEAQVVTGEAGTAPAVKGTDWVQQWTADGPEDLRRQFIAWKSTWLKSQTPDVIAQANDALLLAIGLMRSRKPPYVFDVAGDGIKGGKCTVKLRLATVAAAADADPASAT